MASLRTRIARLERRQPRARPPVGSVDAQLVRALDVASEATHAHLRDLHDAGDRAGFDALVDRLLANPAAVAAAYDAPALTAWARCDGPLWEAEVRALYYDDPDPAVASGVDAGALADELTEVRAALARGDQGAVCAAQARVRLRLRAVALS